MKLNIKKGLMIMAMASAAPAVMPIEAQAQSVFDSRRPGRGGQGRHEAYRYEISLVRQAIHAAYDRRSRRPFMTARRNFRSLQSSVQRMRNRRVAHQIMRLIRHTEVYGINNFRASVWQRQRVLSNNGNQIINLLRTADDYGRPGRGGGIGRPGHGGGDGYPGRGGGRGPGRGGR